MNKYILFFISLISISLCAYLPLKKHNGFDDNVCGYKFSSVYYVKTCKDEGKYCKYIDDDLSLCEDIPKPITLKTLGDDCNTKLECEKGLYCYGGKCTISNSALGCAANYEPHKTKSGWECKLKASIDYCTYKDDVTITGLTQYSTDYFKVCGEINFKSVPLGTGLGTGYDVMSIKYNYIGTVADDKFVYDAKACKSGFALPFYPDGGVTDPSTSNVNKMFLKCVNINEIDYKGSNDCTFKYDTDKIYYSNRLNYGNIFSIMDLDPNIQEQRINDLCDEYLMTRLEIFSKYI